MPKVCDDVEAEHSCILLKSNAEKDVFFHYQSLECDKCDFLEAKVLHPNAVEKLVLDFVSFGTSWRVVDSNNDTICREEEYFFHDGGNYTMLINDTHCVINEGQSEDVYLPIIIAVAIYLSLGVLYGLYNYLERKKLWDKFTRSKGSFDELAASYSSNSFIEERPKQAKQRLRSLDTVRGIAIILMIFVNYGGGKYWFFDHTPWNGLNIADLVFPWFIWMMGLSMTLSLRSLLRKSVPRKSIFGKIIKRSVILFSLGVMLNTLCLNVDLSDLRILGVLQRFGLCYLVVSTVHIFFAEAENTHEVSSFAVFRDIFKYWVEWCIMITLLLVHILLSFLLHVPGCPTGYLGPGGMHDGGNYSLCTGGAAGYIDRMILGESHLYQYPTIKQMYHSTLPYDPEGILGYLTCIFLVFLGLQAGKILLTYESDFSRICRWLTWSLCTGLLALLLCKASKNDGWIPINKNLWSISFICATGSLAFLLMALCYYVIDVRKWWTGAPFYYAGMNSILLYVGHSLTHNVFPWSWKVPNTHASQLAMDLWGTTLWILISIWAFKIDFFVTV